MSDERGLTLIELVVVAFLIAILSSILYGTLGGIIRTRDTTEAIRTTERTAHYIFGRIGMEINGRSFVALNTDANNAAPTPTPFPGVPSLQEYMVGESKHDGDFDADRFRFVSANAAQAFVGSPGNFGLVEVEYRLENSKDNQPGSALPKRLLIRAESPAGVTNPDTLKHRTIELPLAEDVVSLKFRFLKGGKWQSGWHETASPLPEMIELTVGIKSSDDRVEFYRTAFPITQRSRPNNGTGQQSP